MKSTHGFWRSALAAGVIASSSLLANSPALAADRYELDPVHSHINFKILHLGIGYQYGRFNDLSGTVVVDEAHPANSKVDVTVKTASVDTKNEKRNEHLRSPDFFNAKQFPNLTFKSTHVEKIGKDSYKVTGTLSLHGKSKTISFVFKKTGEGKDPWGHYRMGGETTFTLNRMDYGINFMPDGLGKDVTLMLSFEGVKK